MEKLIFAQGIQQLNPEKELTTAIAIGSKKTTIDGCFILTNKDCAISAEGSGHTVTNCYIRSTIPKWFEFKSWYYLIKAMKSYSK